MMQSPNKCQPLKHDVIIRLSRFGCSGELNMTFPVYLACKNFVAGKNAAVIIMVGGTVKSEFN